MKSILIAVAWLSCILIPLATQAQEQQQSVCGTTSYWQRMCIQYPYLSAQRDSMNTALAQIQDVPTSPVTVHVAVHVVYNVGDSPGQRSNITNTQITSQIEALNRDFSSRDSARAGDGVTWVYSYPTNISFELDTIIRKQTTASGFFDDDVVKTSATLGSLALDPLRYLNIWVCDLRAEGGILPYPGYTTSISGYAPGQAGDSLDGVVINYGYFGQSGNLREPAKYGMGRVCVHEVGHWLALDHPWGNGDTDTTCSIINDQIDDTPPCRLPWYAKHDSSCAVDALHMCGNTRRMVETFMDYSDDGCRTLFTPGQIRRMRAALLTGRSGISRTSRAVTLQNSFGGGTLRASIQFGAQPDGFQPVSSNSGVRSGNIVYVPDGKQLTIGAKTQFFPVPPDIPSYKRRFSIWSSNRFQFDGTSDSVVSFVPDQDGNATANFRREFNITLTDGQNVSGGGVTGGTYSGTNGNGTTFSSRTAYTASFLEFVDSAVHVMFTPPGTDGFVKWSDGNENRTHAGIIPTDHISLYGLYKSHLITGDAAALANPGQKRIIRDGAGVLHMVYADGGMIWYTHDTVNGWTAEQRISDASGTAKNPSICITTNPYTIHVVWEQVSYAGNHYVHYLHSTNGVLWHQNWDQLDFGKIVGPEYVMNAVSDPVDATPVVGGSTYPVICWKTNDGIAVYSGDSQNHFDLLTADPDAGSLSIDGQNTIKLAYVHQTGTQGVGLIDFTFAPGDQHPAIVSNYWCPKPGAANPVVAGSPDGTRTFLAYDALVDGVRRVLLRERLDDEWQPERVMQYNGLAGSNPTIALELGSTANWVHIFWRNSNGIFIRATRPYIGITWNPCAAVDSAAGLQIAPLTLSSQPPAAVPAGVRIAGVSPFTLTAYMPQTPSTAPVAVTPADEASSLLSSVGFSWTPVKDAEGYRIQIAASPAFTGGTIVRDIVSTPTSFTIQGLGYSQEYFWRVAAVNYVGQGSYSAVRSFSTMEPSAPPALLSPANGASSPSTSVCYRWQPVPGATSYRVAWFSDAQLTTQIHSTPADADSLRYDSQSYATTLYWRVSTVNQAGEGPPSGAWAVVMPAAPPSIGLSGSVSNSHPFLSWTRGVPPFTLKRHDCLKSNPGSCNPDITIYYGSDSTFLDYGVTVVSKTLASAIDYYTVTDVNGLGSNTLSFYAEAFIGDKTALNMPVETRLDGAYPNPFNPATSVDFQIAEPAYVTITVFDALGREIETLVQGRREPGLFNVRWAATDKPSGIYLLRMTSSNDRDHAAYTAVKKLMLMK